MKRTPLRRTPMRKKPSSKQPMTSEVYETVMGRRGGRCEAHVASKCTGRAEHWHHRQLRSRGGENIVENGLAVCHACHEHIHRFPLDSREAGFMVSSWGDPATQPVLIGGLMVILTPEGGYIATGKKVA